MLEGVNNLLALGDYVCEADKITQKFMAYKLVNIAYVREARCSHGSAVARMHPVFQGNGAQGDYTMRLNRRCIAPRTVSYDSPYRFFANEDDKIFLYSSCWSRMTPSNLTSSSGLTVRPLILYGVASTRSTFRENG